MREGEFHMVSASIDAVCYRESVQTLQVRLKDGRTYRYYGVPKNVCHGLTKSVYHLDYIRSNIAPKFESVEIHAEGAAKAERVRIQNFRSILDMTIRLDDLTVLIGPNGTGKTTALEAIGLFGPGEQGLAYDDIGRGLDQTNITLSFRVSGPGVSDRFLASGMVELRRTFMARDPGKPRTAAAVMLNRDFDRIRNAASVAEKRQEIGRVQERYPDFPVRVTEPKWESEFAEYEHRLSLDPKYRARYAKRFMGFSPGEIDLSKILEVVTVPTTRDIVADASEGNASNLSRLMDLAVHSSGKRVIELWKRVMTIDEADKSTRHFDNMIRDLNERLRRNSERYMSGAEFTVDLLLPGSQPEALKASVRMKDGEFMEDMARAGSGAQRAYLFALLDTIAELTKEAREREQGSDRAPPVRLLAIDEPELHQHPQRQRHMLHALEEMANDPSVRIVCSTHSPQFVRLKRVDTLRIFRRGKKRVWSTTRERLVGLMRPGHRSVEGGWKEVSGWLDMSDTRWAADGFFARLVVITEGPGDRNMLRAAAHVLGIDLDRQEITIVPAGGVNNVEGFLHLFREFGITTYVIWDLDRSNSHRRNQKLADVAVGKTFEGSLDTTTINKNFACVRGDMTEAMITELHSCADILSKNHTYMGLEKARTNDEGSKRRKSCSGNASKKTAGRAQKKFLNYKLNVIELLEAVCERNREGLELFTAVRIVRALQGAAGPH